MARGARAVPPAWRMVHCCLIVTSCMNRSKYVRQSILQRPSAPYCGAGGASIDSAELALRGSTETCPQQPMNDSTEIARSIAATHKNVPGGLLPALHGIQDALGHIPKDAVAAIAGEFNLSRAEVHGVITYYHHFRS